MTTTNVKREYIFDAEGQKLGRLATQIADSLRGKNEPDYQPHRAPNVTVVINNASKLEISDKKLKEEYVRYSGFPGGLKKETRGHLLERRGYQEILERTVYGMIPNNKLRAVMMKNLIINE
jgi:large subunit ribosomal protein L13